MAGTIPSLKRALLLWGWNEADSGEIVLNIRERQKILSAKGKAEREREREGDYAVESRPV